MSKDKPEQQVFDVERIRELIELMKEHELNEVDLRQDMQRIRLRRGDDTPTVIQAPMPVAPPAAAAAPAAATSASAPAEDDNAIYITSPTVGTFYSKPKPDSPNFVKVGDVVDADTIVCLVEAMKMFNEIPAGVSGKVVACLVENEEAVEVNKPLFKVVPV
jgi:acetyl-CoA carboxylase biotin carboxyl carrier protein